MGCSPSKGQLFTGVYNHSDSLKDPQPQSNSDALSYKTEILDTKIQTETGKVSTGIATIEEESRAVPLQGKIFAHNEVLCETSTITEESVDVLESNSPEKLLTDETTDIKDENSSKTTSREMRQRKSLDQTNRLHESLLRLLDMASQTQLSIQPLVDLLVLQCEEINQILEEMANEGKQLLDHCKMTKKDQQVKPDIRDDENPDQTPPDLLHMLQDFNEKMRLVGDSVKEIDTAHEEALEYFSSMKHLLEEKLLAKRTVEELFKEVLSRVEAATLRKVSPEDASLHSEDSGIAADNDCQTTRQVGIQCKSSGSGASSGSSTGCLENPDKGLQGEKNDDDGDDDDDEVENNSFLKAKKMSTQSHKDPGKMLQVILQNDWPDNFTIDWSSRKDRNIRRPQTANNPSVPCPGKPRFPSLRGPWRSQSADCLYSKVEHGVAQRQDRCQSLQKTKKAQTSQHLNVVPCLRTKFVPEPPGKNAVKRLICTFSQGVQDTSNQKPSSRPARFRSKHCFMPALTKCKASVSSYPLEKEFAVKPEEVDLESLPPPPLEVLMDSSFGGCTVDSKTLNSRQDQRRIQQLQASLQTGHFPNNQDDKSVGSQTAPSADGIEFHQESDLQFGAAGRPSHIIGLKDQGMKPGQGNSGYTTSLAPGTRILPLGHSVHHRDLSRPTLFPSPSSTSPVLSEAMTALPSPCLQRWTRRSNNESGHISASNSSLFGKVQTQLKPLSTSQALRPSCRSTLPRPWGEVSRGRLQSATAGQAITGNTFSGYKATLNKQRASLCSVSEPHSEGSDGKTSASERRGSEQEVPSSCVMFAAQQVEHEYSEIKDNQD